SASRAHLIATPRQRLDSKDIHRTLSHLRSHREFAQLQPRRQTACWRRRFSAYLSSGTSESVHQRAQTACLSFCASTKLNHLFEKSQRASRRPPRLLRSIWRQNRPSTNARSEER